MKSDLRDIWQAETRAAAETAMDVFAEKYGATYEKALTCLTKDPEVLLAFHDVPADHWDHLRTGNPIESVRAGPRTGGGHGPHRHRQAPDRSNERGRCLRVEGTVAPVGPRKPRNARLMVYKRVQAAAKGWRRLKGANHLPMVIEGIKVTDGIAETDTTNRAA